jgi:hypothetical protein
MHGLQWDCSFPWSPHGEKLTYCVEIRVLFPDEFLGFPPKTCVALQVTEIVFTFKEMHFIFTHVPSSPNLLSQKQISKRLTQNLQQDLTVLLRVLFHFGQRLFLEEYFS